MSAINKLGTQIRFADGREATVVYNGLDGVGVKWGLHEPKTEDYRTKDGHISSGLFYESLLTEPFRWYPEAMLREPYDGADLPCVPDEYEIIRDGSEITQSLQGSKVP